MASENKSKVSILTNGIIKENPVLRLVLGIPLDSLKAGLCPAILRLTASDKRMAA